MPILKKTLNADTARKIIRMQKDTAIPGHDYCYPMYYLQLNNMYIGHTQASQSTALWTHNAGDTVIMLVEIQGYGHIYGNVNSGFYIVCDTGSSDYPEIQWFVGGTKVAAVNCPDIGKPYTVGWLGITEGGVAKCQPFFNDAVVSGSSAYTFSETGVVLIGGACEGSAGQPCIANYGGSWAIRIYEVVADMASTGAWHLYACEYSDGHSATKYGMFEAENRKNTSYRFREAIAGATVSGVTPSSSVGNFPTEGYGVQLFDLKSITGSKYNDLLAIMADDGGIDTRTGWDSSSATVAYKLTRRSDSAQIPFAFWLGSSSQSGRISIPSGYDYPSTGSTPVGQLVSGRQPKWSIWNDFVKFGKYAEVLQNGSKKVHFNIFCDNAGTNNQRVFLESFEGYDTSKYHTPNIGLSGEINFEYYNGFCSICSRETQLMGSTYDRCCVFAFNRDGGGIGSVRLGNLPLWNYTDADQQGAVQTGLANLIACGAGLRVTCQGATGVYEEIAMMCKSVKDTGDMSGSDPINFSSDSSQDTKDMFQIYGFDATSILSDRSIEYMRDLLSEFSTRGVRGELIMTKSVDPSPAVSAQIDCTDLVPVKQSTAKGKFDNIIYDKYPSNYQIGTGDDRFIVGETGGKAIIGNNSYNIEIFGGSPSDRWGRYGQTDVGDDCMNQTITSQIGADETTLVNHGYAIDLGFALKTPDADSCLKIFGSDQDTVPVMAFLSVFAQSKTIVATYDEEVSTAGTQAFTSRQAQGNYNGCDVTINVGTVTRTDNSSTSVTFNVYLPYSSSGTSSKLVLYVSTNSTITRCEFDMWYTQNAGEASVLTINVSDVTVSGEHYAQISGSVYKNNVTIHTDITSSYHLSNKYFGFTKIINACYNSSSSERRYIDPLYPFTGPLRYHNGTRIQPSDYNVSGGGDYATNKWRGAAFFMWKDLTGTRNASTERPTDGITCYMRVYAQDSRLHSWLPYRAKSQTVFNEGEAIFDTISENLHSYSNTNTVKDIYFHNPGDILENSTLGSSNFVDAWITLWDTTGNPHNPQSDHQITAANALNGMTLRLYEEVLHEPIDSASGAEPIELCHFTFDSSSSYVTGLDSNNQETNFHMYVDAGLYAPFFTRLPINNTRYGEFNNSGFYNLRITNSSIQPSGGSMYYIKITS